MEGAAGAWLPNVGALVMEFPMDMSDSNSQQLPTTPNMVL